MGPVYYNTKFGSWLIFVAKRQDVSASAASVLTILSNLLLISPETLENCYKTIKAIPFLVFEKPW